MWEIRSGDSRNTLLGIILANTYLEKKLFNIFSEKKCKMGLEHMEEYRKWQREERSDKFQDRLERFLDSSEERQERSEQRQERLERKQDYLDQKQELLSRDTLLTNKVGRRINKWILAFAIIATITSAFSILSQIFKWFD